MRYRTSLLPCLVAVSLTLIAHGARAQPPATPTFPDLPEGAPAGTGIIQPCMEELEGSVRCGRYRVWENREAQSGRTIDLGFVIADALDPDSRHSDAITFFFGGPGSSVIDASPFIIPDSEMRKQRDLLFLDFRGVGASQPIDCDVPYPGGVESRFENIFPVDHIEACRDRLTERTDLRFYTSENNIDDLEELRGWLNYSTLNLNGGSYGTHEIQVYLRRYPDSVRTAVMNGVSPIFEHGYLKHARGLQAALDELIAECALNAGCADAYPDFGATMERVLGRTRTDPPEVQIEGKTVRFGRGALGYALRGLLYRRGADVPAMVTQAANGDWQPLASYYLARTGWVAEPGGESGMHFSVICAEDISRVDDELIARETEGTFLGDFLINGYKRACEVWPYARLDPTYWEPVKSDVPSLLLSGNRDPVTPPSGAVAVAEHLSNSFHIVVPGAGHGVGGPCIGQIVRQLLDSASVENLDASCVEERPPVEFALPEAGASP